MSSIEKDFWKIFKIQILVILSFLVKLQVESYNVTRRRTYSICFTVNLKKFFKRVVLSNTCDRFGFINTLVPGIH